MKKNDKLGMFVWLIVMAAAAVGGVFIVKKFVAAGSYFGKTGTVLVVLGSVVFGAIFNAFIFEVAHRIGAKIGKYKVISSSVLYFTVYRENGKKKFGFKSFEGLTGETKIFPKDINKSNPKPFLLAGTIAYLIEFLLCVGGFIALTINEDTAINDLAYALLLIALAGGAILINNILPFKLDNLTDGYGLKIISEKNGKVKFNEILAAQYGAYLEEEDKKELNLNVANNDETPVDPNANKYSHDEQINALFLNLENDEYTQAENVIDSMIVDEGRREQKDSLKVWKIFLHLLNNDEEEQIKFYDEEVPLNLRREIGQCDTIEEIKAYILMSGLLDKAKFECNIALNKVNKIVKKLPACQRPIELKLVQIARNKVLEKHPNWELTKID